MPSLINMRNVRYVSEQDPVRRAQRIKLDIHLCQSYMVGDFTLQRMNATEMVNYSNYLMRHMLREFRYQVNDGDEFLKLLHKLRDMTMDMAGMIPDYRAYELATKMMDTISSVEQLILEHPEDRQAFEVAQHFKTNGEVEIASTEFSGHPQSGRQEREVRRDVRRIGSHPGEEAGTDGTLLPPPDMDA